MSDTDYSDADGNYSLTTIETGVHTLMLRESLSTGDCQTGGTLQITKTFYVEENETVAVEIFDDLPGTSATVTGRLIDLNGNPIAHEDVLFDPRDSEQERPQYTFTTETDGTFTATVPAGNYVLSSQQWYSCFDVNDPLSGDEVCLRLMNWDQSLAPGVTYDVGDLQQERGERSAVAFDLYEETSPGVFAELEPDSLRILSYELADNPNLFKQYYPGNGDLDGNELQLGANTTVDWVFDIVAQKDNAFYYGSTVIGAPGSTANGSVTWDALDAQPQKANSSGYDMPLMDFVMTKRFDLDDPENPSLNETFDPAVANAFTLSNGITIAIPANAIDSYLSARITAELSYEFFDYMFPDEGSTYDFKIYNESEGEEETFLKPLTITMPYSEDVVTVNGVTESDFAPWFFDQTLLVWKHLPAALYTVNTVDNEISFSARHFSTYGLIYNPVSQASTKVSSGNDAIVLRGIPDLISDVIDSTPSKIKQVKTQKKLRAYRKIKKSGRLDAGLGITLKRPAEIIDGYHVRFSAKKGGRRAMKPYKKGKVFGVVLADVATPTNPARDRITMNAIFRMNKKFYIRVRAYRLVGESLLVGKWSKPKAVLIKSSDTGL